VVEHRWNRFGKGTWKVLALFLPNLWPLCSFYSSPHPLSFPFLLFPSPHFFSGGHFLYTQLGGLGLKVERLKLCIAVRENPSQSCGASPAMWDNTVFPATRLHHSQTGWYSIDLPKRDRRLSWPWVGYIPRWFTCLHSGSDHFLATRPESKSRPLDREYNVLTVLLPGLVM